MEAVTSGATPRREPGTDDVTTRVADFVASTKYEALPDPVVEAVKRSMLDTFASAAAPGLAEGDVAPLVRFVRARCGAGRSTVWFSPARAPAAAAALANGALAHALDFDDIFDRGPVHVGAALAPALLAIVEDVDFPMLGTDLVAAYAVGGELLCRCADVAAETLSNAEVPVVLYSQLFGYFAAAAACAQLLRLSVEQTESALGLALAQAAGTMEIVTGPRSVGKAVYEAFSNQGGVQSALLAAEGLDGRNRTLGGAAGLFSYHLRRDGNVARLTERLGDEYLLTRLSFKPWPCTKVSHPFLEAALVLRERLAGDVAAIEEIVLSGAHWSREFSEPKQEKARPETSSAAKNSVPFVVAVALSHGTVETSHFLPLALADERVIRLAEKVRFEYVPQLGTTFGYDRGTVQLLVRGGVRDKTEVSIPLGDFRRPLDFAALADKFTRHARLHRSALRDRLSHVPGLVSNIENLDDVRVLARSLGEALS